MMNGCICCTVRGDLVVALKKLHSKVSLFDAIIIETTGLADQHRQSAAPSSSPCPGRLGRTASDKGCSTYSGGTREPYRPQWQLVVRPSARATAANATAFDHPGRPRSSGADLLRGRRDTGANPKPNPDPNPNPLCGRRDTSAVLIMAHSLAMDDEDRRFTRSTASSRSSTPSTFSRASTTRSPRASRTRPSSRPLYYIRLQAVYTRLQPHTSEAGEPAAIPPDVLGAPGWELSAEVL